MATMANAVLVFQTAGTTEIVPSDNVVIDLISTQMISYFSIDAIKASVGNGTASSPSVNSAFEVAYAGTLNSEGMLSEYLSASDTSPIPAPGVSGRLYSFVYHVPDVPINTYIIIGTYADGENWLSPQYTVANGGGTFTGTQYFTPLVLHYFPEPMTMGLLGLGGLFLRRRK